MAKVREKRKEREISMSEKAFRCRVSLTQNFDRHERTCVGRGDETKKTKLENNKRDGERKQKWRLKKKKRLRARVINPEKRR